MSEEFSSEALYQEIIRTYLDTESVKDTAAKLETSVVKVRKVLITEGLWSSKTSLEIQHYLNLGKTTAEIAEILSTTEKAVQQYLPYTRGLYNGDNPSVAAINSADYRERIRVAKENIVRQNINMAIQNRWYEIYETPELTIARMAGEIMGDSPTVDSLAADSSDSSDPSDSDDDHFYPGKFRIPKGTDHKNFKSIFFMNPVRLHLEIDLRASGRSWMSQKDVSRNIVPKSILEVLKKHGGVQYGDSISRDIIVPGDMPLWALHYAIQKCFGWQNSDEHHFELSKEQFRKVCDEDTMKYLALVGVAFRSPLMDSEEMRWADDYADGSVKTWLQTKYTGPYASMCHGEGFWQCRQDVKKLMKKYKYANQEHEDRGGWITYHAPKPISKKKYDELKALGESDCGDNSSGENSRGQNTGDQNTSGGNCSGENCSGESAKSKNSNGLVEVKNYWGITTFQKAMTLEELPFYPFTQYLGTDEILERLTVGELFVLRHKGMNDDFYIGDHVPSCFDDVMNEYIMDDIERYENIDSPDAQPYLHRLTDELYYVYESGDGWRVKITGSLGAADLIESGRVTQEELDKAVVQMHETYRPICIAQDGLNVFDEINGIEKFCEFLKGINRPSKKEIMENYQKRSLPEGAVYTEEFLAWFSSLPDEKDIKDWDADDWDDYLYDEFGGQYSNKEESLAWAKSLGWNRRKISNKNIL